MAPYLWVCSFVWEVPLARQVEQHRMTITNKLRWVRRWPLSLGVAADAVTVFDLKQGDCRSLVITPTVEVYALPPMLWSTIQHISNESLVAEKFKQELLLLLLCSALGVKQEFVHNQGKYLIVREFSFRNNVRSLSLRDWIRGFSLRDRIRGFSLRDGIRGFILKIGIRDFSFRDKIRRFSLRDKIRRISFWDSIRSFRFRNGLLYLTFVLSLNLLYFLSSFFLQRFEWYLKFKILSCQIINNTL